jgi:DNA-binding CsgD family transcriptional regulator
MASLLVRFFEGLIYDLGLKRENRRRFELDDALDHSVQDLALREGHSPEETVSRLVAEALDHRQAEEERMRIWGDLTPREKQVAALVCLHYTNAEIAQHLILSEETVKTHLQRVFHKFSLHRKDELRHKLAHWDFQAWGPKEEEE